MRYNLTENIQIILNNISHNMKSDCFPSYYIDSLIENIQIIAASAVQSNITMTTLLIISKQFTHKNINQHIHISVFSEDREILKRYFYK